MNISDYTFQKTIGKGSYGKVYKVLNRKNSKIYALKQIKIHPIQHSEKLFVMNELRLLASHESDYIIRFKSCFIDMNYLCLVTEYAEKGDLSLIIKNKQKTQTIFSENEIWHYFLQISVGLSYLHKFNIIHRDMKPANVFIDRYNNVKIGDLGIIKIMRNYMMYGQTQIGTPLYMSPEIYKRERYDIKVDIWALGCILYELMTLKPAFYAENISELKCKIFSGRFNIIYYTPYRHELKNLLRRLINIQPRLRPTIADLLNTNYVQKQLQLRKLNLDRNLRIKENFFENCFIPKKIEDWKSVILHYTVNLKLTVHDERDIERINMIEAANIQANLLMEKTKQEKFELNKKIKEKQYEIIITQEILNEKKVELNQLQNELKKLEIKPEVTPKHTPVPKKYTPMPPLHRPINPRPNIFK